MAYLPAGGIGMLFVALPPGFGGLYSYLIFCHEMIISEVIKEIATVNSMQWYY